MCQPLRRTSPADRSGARAGGADCATITWWRRGQGVQSHREEAPGLSLAQRRSSPRAPPAGDPSRQGRSSGLNGGGWRLEGGRSAGSTDASVVLRRVRARA